MPGIGPMELIIVLVIALIFLGPKKLPEAGRSLGRGLREFKDSVTGKDSDDAGAVAAGGPEARLGDLGPAGLVRPQRGAEAPAQLVDHEVADVVPVPGVLVTRVAEPDDEPHLGHVVGLLCGRG